MARILIIEDDPHFSDMLRLFLERVGHTALLAANGSDGCRLFRDEQPIDLVITDIYMPEQDGLQTIRDLKRDHPATRIIAVSGGGRSMNLAPLDYARDFGADRTLAKPFELAELSAMLTELLGDEKSGSGRSTKDPIVME